MHQQRHDDYVKLLRYLRWYIGSAICNYFDLLH